MTDKTVLKDKAFKYKVRCLNIHRKLFRDLQEHEISPEIKQNCNVMEKSVQEENFPAAKEYCDKTAYLLQVVHQLGYIPDDVYESLKVDSDELSVIIDEYLEAKEV